MIEGGNVCCISPENFGSLLNLSLLKQESSQGMLRRYEPAPRFVVQKLPIQPTSHRTHITHKGRIFTALLGKFQGQWEEIYRVRYRIEIATVGKYYVIMLKITLRSSVSHVLYVCMYGHHI